MIYVFLVAERFRFWTLVNELFTFLSESEFFEDK